MPENRRQPGEVRDAIIESLRKRGGAATVKEVHTDVERSIGRVPASSVRSYLQIGVRSNTFVRVGRGTYKLAARAKTS